MCGVCVDGGSCVCDEVEVRMGNRKVSPNTNSAHTRGLRCAQLFLFTWREMAPTATTAPHTTTHLAQSSSAPPYRQIGPSAVSRVDSG